MLLNCIAGPTMRIACVDHETSVVSYMQFGGASGRRWHRRT